MTKSVTTCVCGIPSDTGLCTHLTVEPRPQPAPETGEWRVEAMPTHGWRVVDATGQEIVADVYRKEDAEQIVADHNAVPRLVEALTELLAVFQELEMPNDKDIISEEQVTAAYEKAVAALRRSG